MARYIIKTASAKMPPGVLAPYRRIAIIELEDGWNGDDVAMISDRARGVKRVVETIGPLHAGHGGSGTAYAKWLITMTARCAALNGRGR